MVDPAITPIAELRTRTIADPRNTVNLLFFGGFYGLPFAPYNPFDRPVRSDKPQPPQQNSLDL